MKVYNWLNLLMEYWESWKPPSKPKKSFPEKLWVSVILVLSLFNRQGQNQILIFEVNACSARVSESNFLGVSVL